MKCIMTHYFFCEYYVYMYVCHFPDNFDVIFIEQYLAQHTHVLESRVLPIFKDIADSRARNRDELDGKFVLVM